MCIYDLGVVPPPRMLVANEGPRSSTWFMSSWVITGIWRPHPIYNKIGGDDTCNDTLVFCWAEGIGQAGKPGFCWWAYFRDLNWTTVFFLAKKTLACVSIGKCEYVAVVEASPWGKNCTPDGCICWSMLNGAAVKGPTSRQVGLPESRCGSAEKVLKAEGCSDAPSESEKSWKITPGVWTGCWKEPS